MGKPKGRKMYFDSFQKVFVHCVGEGMTEFTQKEFVVEAAPIMVNQAAKRAKMKSEVGITIKDLP